MDKKNIKSYFFVTLPKRDQLGKTNSTSTSTTATTKSTDTTQSKKVSKVSASITLLSYSDSETEEKHEDECGRSTDQLPCNTLKDQIQGEPHSPKPTTSSSEFTDCENLNQQINIEMSPIDVGCYIDKISQLTDMQRHCILTNHFIPDLTYKFPFSSHCKQGKIEKRFLNLAHINAYEWVVYSDFKKGLFCKYCSVFAGKQAGRNQLRQFVTEPKVKFSKLFGKDGDFENHASHDYHKSSVTAAKCFEATLNNPESGVLMKMRNKNADDILKNRERLTPIIKSIIFLGKQNCALRGHRDDGTLIDHIEGIDLVNHNEGNFRELLKFRIDAGDSKLEDHLKNANANATYISKTTQNDLISCIGETIQDKVLSRVHAAKMYGISIDETDDISHVSQLSLILNYVLNGVKYEDFLCFIDVHEDVYGKNFDASVEPKLTGEILGKQIVETLQKFGLDTKYCTSISTDTCNLMSSEQCGVVAEIQKVATNAVWDPCLSHSLNLSNSKSSNVSLIRNCCNVISEITSFFHMSGKRNFLIKHLLGSDLVSLCETRFIERYEPIDQFCNHLPTILQCLEAIATWKDTAARSRAEWLLNAVDCKFVFSLFILQDVFSLSLPLARSLQQRDFTVIQCQKHVKLYIQALSDRRENAESIFSVIFEKASSILSEESIEIFIPRQAKRQQNRSNVPAQSAEEYYRRTAYIPCLDNLIADIKCRFSKNNTSVLALSFLLPTNIVKIESAEIEKNVSEYCSKYELLVFKQELKMCRKSFLSEIEIWKLECQGFDSAQQNRLSVDILQLCNPKIFPHIHCFLKIIFTSTATTASAERSFSVLRRLKTWLRSRCKQDRLNGLALMHIHRDINIEIDEIIDRFATSKRRKLNFVL